MANPLAGVVAWYQGLPQAAQIGIPVAGAAGVFLIAKARGGAGSMVSGPFGSSVGGGAGAGLPPNPPGAPPPPPGPSGGGSGGAGAGGTGGGGATGSSPTATGGATASKPTTTASSGTKPYSAPRPRPTGPRPLPVSNSFPEGIYGYTPASLAAQNKAEAARHHPITGAFGYSQQSLALQNAAEANRATLRQEGQARQAAIANYGYTPASLSMQNAAERARHSHPAKPMVGAFPTWSQYPIVTAATAGYTEASLKAQNKAEQQRHTTPPHPAATPVSTRSAGYTAASLAAQNAAEAARHQPISHPLVSVAALKNKTAASKTAQTAYDKANSAAYHARVVKANTEYVSKQRSRSAATVRTIVTSRRSRAE